MRRRTERQLGASMMIALMSALLLACSTDAATDTADGDLNLDQTDSGQPEACEVSVRVDAVPVSEMPNPTVGESWTLIMYCDETILMGPAVLRIEPADLATLDETTPTLTFIKAGMGEIQYQIGSRKVNIPVRIEAAQ